MGKNDGPLIWTVISRFSEPFARCHAPAEGGVRVVVKAPAEGGGGGHRGGRDATSVRAGREGYVIAAGAGGAGPGGLMESERPRWARMAYTARGSRSEKEDQSGRASRADRNVLPKFVRPVNRVRRRRQSITARFLRVGLWPERRLKIRMPAGSKSP